MDAPLPARQSSPAAAPLARQIGLPGAVMLGLGSILGTGVFVSIAIATGAAGPAVVLAIGVAGLVAAANALSSAQLAAAHPQSGGTYEYAYRWLGPRLGFTAGWMFLCAKAASAATAALGAAGYLLHLTGGGPAVGPIPLAVAIVVALTFLVLCGVRRTSAANIVIVSLTIVSLLVFIFAGLPLAIQRGEANMTPMFAPVADGRPLAGFLQACAFMFVAYTGYGRIATLAEEVHAPRRNIPLAIIVTLLISLVLYIAVGLVGVASVGAETFAGSENVVTRGAEARPGPAAQAAREAPLEAVAWQFNVAAAPQIVAAGAVTAMLGVLVNLILGVSRVVLAMARRGDAPAFLAQVGGRQASPFWAVVLVGGLIAALALVGDVRSTWSFSAFTVLVYYAITNLAAVRMGDDERLFPRPIAWIGLVACLFLAFWVPWRVWATGLGLIVAGLVWHAIATKWGRRPNRMRPTRPGV